MTTSAESPSDGCGDEHGTLDPALEAFLGIPRTYEEERIAVAALVQRASARTGMDFPKLRKYLEWLPLDPTPARALLSKQQQNALYYRNVMGYEGLEIDEGVFDPFETSVTGFMLKHIDFRRGETVLDAFAGSGVFGVFSALRCNRVVSFDSSEAAVACARKNAARNHVGNLMDVRHGTVTQVMRARETFDLIIANPPLLPAEATTSMESALFDPGMTTTIEFVRALPRLLKREGRCYLVTSSVIDREACKLDIAALCKQNGLKISTVAQSHRRYESYRVHKISRRLFSRSLFFGEPK